MKQAFFALATLLMLVIPTPYAFSQSTTTISYDGTVTSAVGTHATAFSPGDQVVVSYTLDPSVADGDVDPLAGYFPGAVRSLSVSFPGVGVSVVTGASGSAWTYNNSVVPSGQWLDQLTLLGGPISSASLLGGEPIDYFPQVDFMTNFFIPPDEPAMLSSDSLPLFKLSAQVVEVHLRTSSGFTHVRIQLNAATPLEKLQALIRSVDALVAAGGVVRPEIRWIGWVLRETLRAALWALTNPRQNLTSLACIDLRAFQAWVQFGADPRRGWLPAEDGASFIRAAQSIRSDLGCR